MPFTLVLAAAVAAASVDPQVTPAVDISNPGVAVTLPPALAPESATPPPAPALILPKGTLVRLMILKEVNSRDNRPGDRFVLRVDEDVRVHGVTVVPTGAKGWGELIQSEGTGGAGRSGKINARLLYVEAGGRKIDLDGERKSSGSGGTGQLVASVLVWGPFGLLMKGNNASLKAGEILNGYTLADTDFSPVQDSHATSPQMPDPTKP